MHEKAAFQITQELHWKLEQILKCDESKFYSFGLNHHQYVRRKRLQQWACTAVKQGGGSVVGWSFISAGAVGDLVKTDGVKNTEK